MAVENPVATERSRTLGREPKVGAIGRDVVIMMGILLVSIGGVAWFSLWDAGYLGSYWERWNHGDGIKCFDAQGRVTVSGQQQPCFVLSQGGLTARERMTEECKAKGQDEENCRELAINQLTSSLPSGSHN